MATPELPHLLGHSSGLGHKGETQRAVGGSLSPSLLSGTAVCGEDTARAARMDRLVRPTRAALRGLALQCPHLLVHRDGKKKQSF